MMPTQQTRHRNEFEILGNAFVKALSPSLKQRIREAPLATQEALARDIVALLESRLLRRVGAR